MREFQRARPKEPQRIGDIEIRLVSHDPEGTHKEMGNQGRILLQVVHDGGAVSEIADRLEDHVGAAALQAVWAMLDNLRAKASTEVLPEKTESIERG